MSSLPDVRSIPVEFAQIVRSRRSVNSFRPDLPARETVLAALELARWAPNHRHTEPWRVYLLGPDTSKRLVDLNTSLVEAAKGRDAALSKRKKWAETPGWLVVTFRIMGDAAQQREDYAATCCFVQNLMLALWSTGIGSKWSTGSVTQVPEFSEIVGFDIAEEEFVALLSYGFPEVVPQQSRTEVSTFVTERK